MLRIIRAEEQIEVKQLVFLIYGQPAMGKTTLANTASKAITLDFDSGVHRAASRQDAVQIREWHEIRDISARDVQDYDTLIIDTVSAGMGYIRDFIIKNNPKALNSAGVFSLQAHGALRDETVEFIQRLKRFGKDIILIAHEKEKENDGERSVRPDISGGSYNEIMKIADFVGHISLINVDGKTERVLNFSPSENRVAKNCANLEPLMIPALSANPEFMRELIKRCKDYLNQLTEAQKEALQTIKDWTNRTEECESPAQLTFCLNELKKEGFKKGIEQQIKVVMMAKVKAEGWAWDAANECFKEGENAPPLVLPAEDKENEIKEEDKEKHKEENENGNENAPEKELKSESKKKNKTDKESELKAANENEGSEAA